MHIDPFKAYWSGCFNTTTLQFLIFLKNSMKTTWKNLPPFKIKIFWPSPTDFLSKMFNLPSILEVGGHAMYDNRMSYYLVIPGDRWEGWQTKEWIGIKWYIKLAALTKKLFTWYVCRLYENIYKIFEKKISDNFFFAKLLPNIVIVRAFTVENYNNNLFPLL